MEVVCSHVIQWEAKQLLCWNKSGLICLATTEGQNPEMYTFNSSQSHICSYSQTFWVVGIEMSMDLDLRVLLADTGQISTRVEGHLGRTEHVKVMGINWPGNTCTVTPYAHY